MKSPPRGKNTSAVEVVQISPHGIWIAVGDREYFLSSQEYPWFLEASVRQIHRVEFLHGHHLYWPDLDVDLELETVEHPEHYPLIAKQPGLRRKGPALAK